MGGTSRNQTPAEQPEPALLTVIRGIASAKVEGCNGESLRLRCASVGERLDRVRQRGEHQKYLFDLRNLENLKNTLIHSGQRNPPSGLRTRSAGADQRPQTGRS